VFAKSLCFRLVRLTSAQWLCDSACLSVSGLLPVLSVVNGGKGGTERQGSSITTWLLRGSNGGHTLGS
jgi:hypothetical protein